MKFDETILRLADIRGIYPTQINKEFAAHLGKVFAQLIKNNKKKYCVVGHDNRFGGPDLTKSLIEGLRSMGVNIIYVGLVTTPMLNYASRKLGIEYGIMVTASHNPKEYNGFKLFGKNYLHCSNEELKEVYDNLLKEAPLSSKVKGNIEYVDVSQEYVEYTLSKINLRKKLKVVVDCGNGTSSVIVHKMFENVLCNPIFIYCDSNPNFPNHHPDPNVKANLQDLCVAVKKNHADIGVTYDGDCDRIGVVDDKGNIIDSDILMAVICEHSLKNIVNKDILIDIKCSKSLEDKIKEMKGNVIVETASSAIQERIIIENKIVFGGGYSNHLFLTDKHYGYDDGMYMSLRVIEMLSNSNMSLSSMLKSINKYYNTDEIKIPVEDKKKFKIVEKVKDYCDFNSYIYSELDGLKIFLTNGWALVRASNTGPDLTLRFEATSMSHLKSIKNEFMDVIGILDK